MCHVLDDRTLHEVYLWPFAEAVKVGVGAVMTAYNAVSAQAYPFVPDVSNPKLDGANIVR